MAVVVGQPSLPILTTARHLANLRPCNAWCSEGYAWVGRSPDASSRPASCCAVWHSELKGVQGTHSRGPGALISTSDGAHLVCALRSGERRRKNSGGKAPCRGAQASTRAASCPLLLLLRGFAWRCCPLSLTRYPKHAIHHTLHRRLLKCSATDQPAATRCMQAGTLLACMWAWLSRRAALQSCRPSPLTAFELRTAPCPTWHPVRGTPCSGRPDHPGPAWWSPHARRAAPAPTRGHTTKVNAEQHSQVHTNCLACWGDQSSTPVRKAGKHCLHSSSGQTNWCASYAWTALAVKRLHLHHRLSTCVQVSAARKVPWTGRI